MYRKLTLLVASVGLSAAAFAQSISWGGSGNTTTVGAGYSVVASGSGLDPNNSTVNLYKNGNYATSVASGSYVAQYNGQETAVGTVNFNATATGSNGASLNASYAVTVSQGSMTPPTSANASIDQGDSFFPGITLKTPGCTGAGYMCVAGVTNWQTSSVTLSGGSYSIYVAQHGDTNYYGGTEDPNVGDLSVNGSPYTVYVAGTPSISVTPSTSVALGTTVTFTASGGNGTGGYVWGGEAGGTGNSTSLTFNTAGSHTVTLYKQGDGTYVNSHTTSVTITVAKGNQSGVSLSPQSPTTTPGGSITFTASGGSGTGAYIWGGQASGTGTTNTVTFPSSGNPTVSVYRQGDANYNDSATASTGVTVAQTYTLTVDNGSGSGSYPAGASVTISANSYSGLSFNYWGYVSGSAVSYNNQNAATTTITMPAGNAELEAVYYDSQPPSAPGSPHTTSVGAGSVTIAWTASSDNIGVTAYEVKVNGVSSGLFSPSYTSYTYTATPNTTYNNVQVVAYDAQGNSSSSTVPSFTTPPDTTAPNVPSRVRASAVSVTTFNLIWDVPYDDVGATQYRVYENGTQIATTTSPSYQVTGLTTDTSYNFTVSAADAANNWSGQSTPVTITTNAPVLLGIHAAAYGTASGQAFSVTSYEDTTSQNAALAVATSATGTGASSWTVAHQYRGFSAGVDNILKVSGPSYQREVRFEVPSGYTLLVRVGNSDVPYTNTATIDLGNNNGSSSDSSTLTFSLMPTDGTTALDAGYAIDPEISISNVVWAMSLGRSPDGLTYGSLALRKTDIVGDPFSIDLLKMTGIDPTTDDGLALIPDSGAPWGNNRRFIRTPSCFIWLDDHVSGHPVGSYAEIKVYDPAATYAWDSTNSTYKITKNSAVIAPFAHYAIQSTTVTNPNDTFTITKNVGQAQAISWTLNKSGTTSPITWTLQRAGNRTLKMVETVSGSGVGSTTTEDITLTDGSGNVAQAFRKSYQMMAWGKRELMSEIDDPSSTSLTTSYTYGTSTTDGSYGKLTSVTKPDGTYVAYKYYSDDANFGNLWQTLTPWLDVSSTAATATSTNAQVVTLTYAPVHYYECDALSSTTTTVPGTGGAVTTSKTLRNPDFTSTTFNGHKVRKETIQSYYNASSYLTTTRLSYHPDETANDRENQLISETGPTGTKISTIYYSGYMHDVGDSNSTLFNSVATGGTSGYGEYKFNGFSTQVTGSVLVNTYDSQPIDPIYLVPNRSTIELTGIINGQPEYKVTYVFTGASGGVPSFEFVGMQKLVIATTTDPNSGITTTTKTTSSHTGAQSVQTFTNGRLMSETANDGSTISYTYDSTGLLTSKAVNGIAASGSYAATPTVYTYYTYDAASRKLTEKTSSSSDPNAAAPTTSYTYDTAGRLSSTTDPTGLVTTLTYNLTNHTTTSTLPGGSTKIVTTYADGTTKSVTGTAVVGQYTNVVVNSDGTVTKTVYALRSSDVANPTAAPRWAKSTVDWLGRATRDETPAIGGTIAKVYTYNAKGELTTVSTVDGTSGTKLVADAITDYNAYEMPYRTGSDLDGNGDLQTASASDQITDTDTLFQKDSSNVWWVVTTTQVYNQASSGTPVTTSTTKVRQNQFPAAGTNVQAETVSIDVFGNQTDTKTAVDRTNILTTTTTTLPNSSTPTISISRNGLQVSDQDAAGHVTTYAYDSLRRLICATDPRIDGSSLAKDLAPRIGYYDQTAPAGARWQKAWTKDTAGNQTNYSYSSSTGLLSATQSPSIGSTPGKFTYYDYSHRGETIRTWGSMTYPVEYAFDDYGEKIAMRTFRGTTDFTGSAWPLTDDGADPQNPDPTSWASGDKTTWSYDTATGVLLSKTDAASKAVAYTYTELGQVRTKTWARGVSITYGYYGDTTGDLLTGELKSVDYSDTPNTNPDVSYTYDRLGHTLSVTDATGSRTFAYSATDTTLTSETLPSLFNNGTNARLLTQKYDTTGTGTKGRSIGFSLGTASATTADYDVTYGYDAYGRAGTVASAGATFTYGYTAGSNLVGSVADNGTYTMTRTWMSNRNLLQSIATSMGTTSKAAFTYAADEWGRRTSAIRSGEVYSRYINGGLVTTWSYDDRSQVTAAQTYYGTTLSDLSYPVEGRSYGFSFDNIGNRLTSSIDGRTTTYDTNNLNQITDRGTPGAVDVSGFAPTGSTVTVTAQGTGQTVDRQGDYYHSAASVDNSAHSVNASITVTSTAPSSSLTRQIFLAKATLGTNEKWTYDADGNLTQDDQWTYTWNAENRLIAMETRADLITAGIFAAADARHLDFTYDYLGRRAEKIVRGGWNGSTFATVLSDTRFIYHGWNLVAELNLQGSTFTLGRSYTWGLDLSGTLAGDGGTGGLLMTQDASTQYVYAYDGNGNVSAVMNRSGGTTVAEYEYGAFGEPLRASNTYAQTNPFRFSTQYYDSETGYFYYGHRYYNPQTGRFLVRDGTEEKGGLNLYGFCGNNGINAWDVLGNLPRFEPNVGGAQVMQWGEQGYQATGGGNSGVSGLLHSAPVVTVGDGITETAVSGLSYTNVSLVSALVNGGQSAVDAYAAANGLAGGSAGASGTLPSASTVKLAFNSTVSSGEATLNAALSGTLPAGSTVQSQFNATVSDASAALVSAYVGAGAALSVIPCTPLAPATATDGNLTVSSGLVFGNSLSSASGISSFAVAAGSTGGPGPGATVASSGSSAPTTTIAPNNAGTDVKVYVMSGAQHGGDFYTAAVTGSVLTLNGFDGKNTYTVIPVGTKDPSPAPGPNTYFVTHQYVEPNNRLLSSFIQVPIIGPLVGNALALTGIGMHYTGTVEVPGDLGGEVTTTTIDNRYGSSNTFYCGKDGSGALLPSDISLTLASKYMTPEQQAAWTNVTFSPPTP